jgi:hypothetical protein
MFKDYMDGWMDGWMKGEQEIDNAWIKIAI